MSNAPFLFKQFTVAQDQCAMKIGTDGVLLGAWVSLSHNPERILDIGSGTGVIALQLAQRSIAHTIDAVEIDENAFIQCTENFDNALWADRLFCFHASIQDFTQELLNDEEAEGYDLIIANPPFYSEDYRTNNTARDAARFTTSLPFQHLIVCTANILNAQGVFAVILPKKEAAQFVDLANTYELYLQRVCDVQGTPSTNVKRVLMEFSFTKKEPVEEHLVIEKSRHHYTEAYKNLVSDFYLKM